MKESDLENERKNYLRSSLSRTDLLPDPIAQFHLWLDEAFAAQLLEPTAMILATVSSQGKPLTRTVLLKGVDPRGFIFFTNLESRKAEHLKKNAAAALSFSWLALERQVVVTGHAIPLSSKEAERYFASRPRESQLSAWSSPQSRVIPSRAFLEQQWKVNKNKFGEDKIPLPPFWGGFCIAPDTVEFWQGGRYRLHDRLQYCKDVRNNWVIERLAP